MKLQKINMGEIWVEGSSKKDAMRGIIEEPQCVVLLREEP